MLRCVETSHQIIFYASESVFCTFNWMGGELKGGIVWASLPVHVELLHRLSVCLAGWMECKLEVPLTQLVPSVGRPGSKLFAEQTPFSQQLQAATVQLLTPPLTSPKLLGKEGFLHSFGWREMWKVSSPSPPPPTHEILHTFLFPLEEWHLDEWRQRCFEMRLWFSVKSRRQFISFTS